MPGRADGIRRYGSDDVRRLRFIRQAQAAGFTLEEIKELLDLDASEDRSRARALADAAGESAGRADRRAHSAPATRSSRLATECGSADAGPARS